MNLGIVHLSDIHISSEKDLVLERAEAIKSAIQPNIRGEWLLVLAYTGDIAFSGTKPQYDIANRFLREVLAKVEQIRNAQVLGTVIVPGNHDCDFSAEGDARPVLLSSVPSNLASVDLEGDSIQQLLKVQRNFFDFEHEVSEPGRATASNCVGWSFSFAQAGRRIFVRCLNTALFSRRKEAAGQLYFPLHAVPGTDNDADFAVTILHHPYGWLAPENSRELRRLLESNSDLVLTGHEHDGDSYTRITRTGEETGYVEGAALQDGGETGFNFIAINLPANTYQIFPYLWVNHMYEAAPSEARVFTRKQSLIESRFENNAEFTKQLNDMGTGFTHPNKELSLHDLFVYPDLRVVSISSKNAVMIQSSNVLSFVSTREYIHIAGAPISGKSTLARALYLDLQREENLVPVLVNGGDLKGSSEEVFNRAVEAAFGEQYRASSYERFRQLERKRKVLLIDDWHRCQLRSKAKKKVLSAGRVGFGKVILFSDDVSWFQLLAEFAEDEGASEAEYCEIKQFGFRLRSEIIRKWHSIGAESGTDDLELTYRISTSEHLLDTLVGKGIVPSWPIFIVSALQTTSFAVQGDDFLRLVWPPV